MAQFSRNPGIKTLADARSPRCSQRTAPAVPQVRPFLLRRGLADHGPPRLSASHVHHMAGITGRIWHHMAGITGRVWTVPDQPYYYRTICRSYRSTTRVCFLIRIPEADYVYTESASMPNSCNLRQTRFSRTRNWRGLASQARKYRDKRPGTAREGHAKDT